MGPTWSVHQYHREGMVIPTRTPGQGRSELTGSLKMWKASALGSPQLLFSCRMLGMAPKYFACKPSRPPTSIKPGRGHEKLSVHPPRPGLCLQPLVTVGDAPQGFLSNQQLLIPPLCWGRAGTPVESQILPWFGWEGP